MTTISSENQHLTEWLNSCVDEEIFHLNVRSLSGTLPYEYLLYSPKISRRNDGRLRDRDLKKYQHIELGGWWCNGVDPLNNYVLMMWGCFKPDHPRRDRQKIHKFIKYEHPFREETRAFFLIVPNRIWVKVSNRSGIPITEEDLQHPGGFWHWVWRHNVPVTIVEGAKKAGALLTAGYAAIAIPGVNAGYRTPQDEYGTANGKPYLIPDLKHFATHGRQVNICFDQDNKPETAQRVRTAKSRMGRLLVNEGCSLRVIDLPLGAEKGVDDFIYALGQSAFDALYNTAVALELWEIKLFTLLTYPPAIALNQRFLGQLLVPEGEKLIVLKAPKGTGKTEWLATEVAKAHDQERRVLIITHRIQLGEALCNRFGVNYVTEVRTNETGALLGYGVCVDSLHQESQARFNPNDWSNNVIIIDECDQVFWHLLNSGTEVQKRRVSVLKNLKQLVQNVLGSSQGKIYLSSADVSDTDVKYVLSLAGEYRVNPFIIVNNYRHVAGNCYNYSGSNPKNLIAALDKAISKGGHHLLCCSAQKAKSKWGTQALEERFRRKFPHLRILRIDSESVADPSHAAFGCIAHLNEILTQYDLVIASPSLETGVSIDIRGHFDGVWGIFQGVQPVNSVRQMLARLRETVDRHIWVREWGMGVVGNGSTSIGGLLRSQHVATQANIALLSAADNDDLSFVDQNFQPESLQTWGKRGSVINVEMRRYIKQFACQSQDPKQVEKAQELFQREVQSLRRLNHDQIPKFIGAFTLNNQDSFLVQEYIEGETYHNCVFERKEEFTESQVRQFLLDVLGVLIYVHSQGITHRDISPDNIICRKQDKKPVIIDFGCIKQSINQLNSSSSPTIILKEGYTPPEVQNGNTGSSSSSDLYSLAVIALVLLTGKLPNELFDINTVEYKWSKITISSKLQIILKKMLQSQPNARYETARKVLVALKSLSSIPSIRTQQTIAHRTFSSSAKNKLWKNPVLWLTPCVVVGLLIGVTRLLPVIFPPQAEMITGFLYKNLTPEQTEINQLISSKQFSLAISQLEQYRQNNPRNSQALIVLQNTKIGLSKSIAIAVVAPISDDLHKAEEMIRGLAQAQWEVNAVGGINGLPIKIILVDDLKDQNTVRKTAQELVNNQDILGIVGHLSSDNSLVASEVYQKGKILMISPTATSTNLTPKGEYIKRTVVNDAIAGGTLASYVSQKLQKKSIAIFYNSQNNYSKSIRESVINGYMVEKGKIAYEADLSDPNFRAGEIVTQAKTAGADVIMLAADSSMLDKALQVMQANNKRLLLIGGNSLYVNDPILSIGCSDAQGIILAVPWNVKNHLNSRYVKTASYLFKAEVSWRSKTSYDALSAIISALKKTPNHTRQSLQETISKPDFSAPSGDEEVVKFDRQGDRIKPVELVTVTAKADICTFEPIKIK